MLRVDVMITRDGSFDMISLDSGKARYQTRDWE